MFCPQCGAQIPDASKFCFQCGSPLTEARGMSRGRQEREFGPPAPDPPVVPPESVQHPPPISGFVVSREDVEVCYASMSDDELTALQRSELTEVARDCLDQELNRRGMVPLTSPGGDQTTDNEAEPAPRQVASWDTRNHRRMAKHVKFISYSALVVGVLFLLLPLSELIPKTPMPGFYTPAGMGRYNPRMAVFIVIVFALPSLCVFAGLRRFRPWGRTIALSLAAITFAVPISWYVLWSLTRPESKDLFGVSAKPKATGFGKFAIITAYVLAAPFVIIGNIGLVTAIVKDMVNPPTRIRPISNIITGEGNATGYCGMDASGRLIRGLEMVNVRGMVVRQSHEGSYLLVDGASIIDEIVVITNRQFPTPSANEKIQVMGVVQCFTSPPAKLIVEAARFPWKPSRDEERVIAAKGQIAELMTWLEAYRRDNGSFPTIVQGLRALTERPKGVSTWKGPYGTHQIQKDPWGHDYVYHYPGEHGRWRGDTGDAPDLICLGADGQPGGEGLNKDIVSWTDH